jgi:hypothetical protein
MIVEEVIGIVKGKGWAEASEAQRRQAMFL